MRRIIKVTSWKRNKNTEGDGYGWRIETEDVPGRLHHGDAAVLPIETWTAEEGQAEAMMAETNPTTKIPKIIPDGPEAAFIALSYNDVDATCMAANVLRKTRSVEVVLAGLFEYVSRHPVAA